MNYSDHSLNSEMHDDDVISNPTELDLALDSAISSESDKAEVKSEKTEKAHVVRRNIEDYLERKALERSLKEVFDDEFLLD